ncbi:hypothetical protein MUK42_17086 [Musa troglodytarum]|uniref:Uncharacterized protein n=1 Tax=Musa troglodytarum TaxID=320322 RepID=A0A9E7L2T8_9LILI|nr:hypothetical protein MUK42_17086 [Musa troglodytarum]
MVKVMTGLQEPHVSKPFPLPDDNIQDKFCWFQLILVQVHRSGPKEQAVASVKSMFLHQVGCQVEEERHKRKETIGTETVVIPVAATDTLRTRNVMDGKSEAII